MRKKRVHPMSKTALLTCCMFLFTKPWGWALAGVTDRPSLTSFAPSQGPVLLAQNEKTSELIVGKYSSDVAGETPEPSTTAGNGASPYASRSGRYHASLELKQQYSDNINSTPQNVLGDWTTIISPSVWISLPAQPQITFAVNTSNASPGGIALFLERPEAFSRYQLYLMYGAILEQYGSYSERDNIKQTVDAFAQYNLRGGLSFNLFNKFMDSQSPMGIGDSTSIDKFQSNLLGGILGYDVSEKFEARADIRRFDLSYESAASAGRDRVDNSLELYFFYKYSPKTHVFLNYEYDDIEYKITRTLDAVNHTPSLGVRLMPTDKTKIIAKAGTVMKRFETNTSGDVSRPSFDLQAFYQATEKTQINLSSSYKLGETTVSTSNYSEDFNFAGTFSWQMTEKVKAGITGSYTINDFGDSATISRLDRTHSISPVLQYKFLEWLVGNLGYTRLKRDSDQNSYDYTNNTYYLQFASGF